jgi:cytochrome c553
VKAYQDLATALVALVIGAPGPASAADIEAGKASATACGKCHGASGEGNGPNPPLAGMAPEQFVQAIDDYRSGKRPHAAMKAFAKPLDAGKTANLAAYYASLKKK